MKRRAKRLLGWQEGEQIAEKMRAVADHNRAALVAGYAAKHQTTQAEIRRVCNAAGIRI